MNPDFQEQVGKLVITLKTAPVAYVRFSDPEHCLDKSSHP